MKIPFFASFLLVAGIACIQIKKSNHQIKEQEKAFWERERKANNIRKKSLDSLDYVYIPEEILTIKNPTKNLVIEDSLKRLHKLSSLSIVNLNGISNTDLKLTYGTANITVLTEFDENYLQLAVALQDLAKALYDIDAKEDCLKVLEFAISTGTDVSYSYYLLAELYSEFGMPEKINDLIQAASKTRSALKETIISSLKTFKQEQECTAV